MNYERKLIKKENFTIPNILSCFRIVLAFVFWYIYNVENLNHRSVFLTGILGLSALTDVLDGKIARKYHMVSELGKILDPIADKITQAVLLLCLLKSYSLMKYLLALFIVKEEYMLIAGSKAVLASGRNDGAKWYGKVNTVVFYTVMIILVLFPSIPYQAANVLIVFSGGSMGMAFVLYAEEYRRIQRKVKQKE